MKMLYVIFAGLKASMSMSSWHSRNNSWRTYHKTNPSAATNPKIFYICLVCFDCLKNIKKMLK